MITSVTDSKIIRAQLSEANMYLHTNSDSGDSGVLRHMFYLSQFADVKSLVATSYVAQVDEAQTETWRDLAKSFIQTASDVFRKHIK